MTLADFTDNDNEVFPEKDYVLFEILVDKISTFNTKYRTDIWDMDEVKISKLLNQLLNHISEAVFFLEPRNVLIEKRLTMKQVVLTMKKHLIKSLDIEDYLINRIDFLNKKNFKHFNKVLLKHLRGIEHGFHSCGRVYDLRFVGEHCTKKYNLSTIDAFDNKSSIKFFKESIYDVRLYVEMESAYSELRKPATIIYCAQNNNFVLNKSKLKYFLKKVFEGDFKTGVSYNSINTTYGKKRIDAF